MNEFYVIGGIMCAFLFGVAMGAWYSLDMLMKDAKIIVCGKCNNEKKGK